MSPIEPLRPSRQTTLATLVAADGAGSSAFAAGLLRPGAPARDLSDLVHSLCALHGRHPGVIDHALNRTAQPPDWLQQAARGFAEERGLLARLVAAAGPLPSTPGQAETESAVASQRHAFEMLARSEREGCAHGAAAALTLDWRAIRPLLEAAARRFGVSVTPSTLPNEAELLDALTASPSIERATIFAAQQVLAQHRGLWSLLEARASARDRH